MSSAWLEGKPVETVLLDMDGTLLDLHFDNHFWGELLPAAWGAERGLDAAAARAELAPRFRAVEGTLDWYCLDYWADELGLDIRALKAGAADRIAWLPGVEAALARLGELGLRRVVVTNSHGAGVALKEEVTGLLGRVEAVHTSHEFGVAKEEAAFWATLAERESLDPATTLLVDDNPDVLAAARTWGIRHCHQIRRPDSTAAERTAVGPGAPDLATIVEGLHPDRSEQRGSA
ncbi:MAG: HAD family hydrolase [Thiohalospira sp.]